MAEININITEMNTTISRLKRLEQDWHSNKKSAPATQGGGKVVNEFEELTRMYESLNNHMIVLASRTAMFFENIRDSYVESDHEAKTNITGNET